ncbi:MAG TPA: hypothetical protein VFJ14_16965 [Nocardioidaceae bacterium]|nr:hypothetical protein [Nocardioidaceae bacterium]
MADQHPTQDQLVDLALGEGALRDVTEQEPPGQHLSTCARCRAEYDEISTAIERSLAASPRIEPPPGFDRAVLDAMAMGTPALGARPRARHRPWLVAAAAAVIGAVLGIGGTLVATQPDDDGSGAISLAGGSALRTDDGERVGAVTRSWVDGAPVIVVDVSEGAASTYYECRLQLAGGREVPAGSWVLQPEEGATWVVPVPAAEVVGVELVSRNGAVWSSAQL